MELKWSQKAELSQEINDWMSNEVSNWIGISGKEWFVAAAWMLPYLISGMKDWLRRNQWNNLT